MAYSPLGGAGHQVPNTLLQHPVVQQIAKETSKSAAQVSLSQHTSHFSLSTSVLRTNCHQYQVSSSHILTAACITLRKNPHEVPNFNLHANIAQTPCDFRLINTWRVFCGVLQVLLRWNMQRGVPVLPKASSVQHLKDNIEGAFDWVLSTQHKNMLDDLEDGTRFINPTWKTWDDPEEGGAAKPSLVIK